MYNKFEKSIEEYKKRVRILDTAKRAVIPMDKEGNEALKDLYRDYESIIAKLLDYELNSNYSIEPKNEDL